MAAPWARAWLTILVSGLDSNSSRQASDVGSRWRRRPSAPSGLRRCAPSIRRVPPALFWRCPPYRLVGKRGRSVSNFLRKSHGAARHRGREAPRAACEPTLRRDPAPTRSMPVSTASRPSSIRSITSSIGTIASSIPSVSPPTTADPSPTASIASPIASIASPMASIASPIASIRSPNASDPAPSGADPCRDRRDRRRHRADRGRTRASRRRSPAGRHGSAPDRRPARTRRERIDARGPEIEPVDRLRFRSGSRRPSARCRSPSTSRTHPR
jgi:hypothetical protein